MDVLNGASLLIMGGIADPLSVNRIQAKNGPLKVGSAASGHGLAAVGDLLIAGKLEVDGASFFDSTLTIGAYTLPTADGAADQVLRSNGSGTVSWATVSGVAATQKIEDTDADTWVHTESIADEDIIRFKTFGTERMVILANGRIGIGTATPATKVDIVGDGTIATIYSQTDSADTSSAGQAIVAHRTGVATPSILAGYGSLHGFQANSTWTGGIAMRAEADASLSSYMGFHIGDPTSIANEKVRIASNGNVGIGTTLPLGKLDILGDGTIAIIYSQADSADTSSAGQAIIAHRLGVATPSILAGYGSLFGFQANSTWTGGIAMRAEANAAIASYMGFHIGDPTNSANEKMRITSAGSVGIGTATPGSKVEIGLATANLEIADAGSVGATEQAWVEVQVGNVTGYLRVYAAK